LGVHVIVSPCWLVIGCRTHSAALVPYTTLFRSETVVKAGMKLTTRKKRGEGGKEVLGPNEPGPGDCVSILEPATKAELAGLADLENIFGGPTTAAFPFPTDIQIPIQELLNPKDISGGPVVASPEQP